MMNLPPGAEGIRFARPANAKPSVPRKPAQDGLIRELHKKSPYPIWTPSFSVAFRLLILVRVWSAMYSSVTADCDEVYNYWEPLHFLVRGDGFRTWEYSSDYAIRSWAYILLHAIPAKLFGRINPTEKRVAFFGVRLALAALSAVCESRFYRSVADNISLRIGRYTLFFMILNAGLYNSATAFLPSSFSMYFVILGFSFALEPVSVARERTIKATICFAVAAIVGWPFSILLAVPFVLEDLLLSGQQTSFSPVKRVGRLVEGGLVGLAVLAGTCATDSYFYGRFVVVPWNIIKYNIFSSSGGPDLYGTEPWYYYILNGLLNFNVLLPMALASFPAVLLTHYYQPKKLGVTKPGQSSALTLLAFRLLPFYLWFTVLSLQAHKEERFMFPAFPLICFQAAVTLGLARGAMEHIYVKVTKAPFRAARTPIFRYLTTSVVAVTTVISIARILALHHYYRAPMPLLFHLQYTELPTLAIYNYPSFYPRLNLTNYNDPKSEEPRMDLSILEQKNLTLCYGKEWYRFPSSFLVPDVLRTEYIKSDFDGMLPKHFVERRDEVTASRRSIRRKAQIASLAPAGFNDRNEEAMDRYVPVESCSYLIDLDYPTRYLAGESSSPMSEHEPRYAVDADNWQRLVCHRFLDASQSPRWSRSFYLPAMKNRNVYGEYCLLRNKKLSAPPVL